MASKGGGRESGAGSPCAETLRVLRGDGHVRPLFEIQRELVRLSLMKNHGNFTKAAAELGIGRSTLYRYVKNHIVRIGALRPRR